MSFEHWRVENIKCLTVARLSQSILLVRQKSTKSIFWDFTRDHFLCNFCRLFLLRRASLFVNNPSQNPNRTATKDNKDTLHRIEPKSEKYNFEIIETSHFLSERQNCWLFLQNKELLHSIKRGTTRSHIQIP